MTDVPLLSLLLAAALSTVLALQRNNHRLLILAMLLTSLACLIRQTGILLVVALFCYLLLTRRLSWRRLVILLVPVVVLSIYLLWQISQPAVPATAAYTGFLSSTSGLAPIVTLALRWFLRLMLLLPTLGLWLLPLAPAIVRYRLRPLNAVLAILLTLLMIRTYTGVPAPAMFMPLDYTASILGSPGFFIFANNGTSAPPLLTPLIWGIISLLMIILTAWLVVGVIPRAITLFKSLRSRPAPVGHQGFIYILALLMGLATIFGIQIYDRYFLSVLPFLLAALLRQLPRRDSPAMVLVLGTLLLVAGFSLLAQADYADRSTARWTAATHLLDTGVHYFDLSAGYEWNGMHYYSEVGQRLPDNRLFAPGQPRDLDYTVDESLVPDYHVIGTTPYFCRLCGFTWRSELLLAKPSATQINP